MRILAGREFGAATLTEFDDLSVGEGRIGDAIWGPSQLLRDLELRLGLGRVFEPDAVRLAKWVGKIAHLVPRDRFYSRAFEVDSLGTGRALLRLRDSLIEAGWNGQTIPDGGARLEALEELEAASPSVPAGYADRLASVARLLVSSARCVYAELVLVEPAELWPKCWQDAFLALELAGTRVTRYVPLFPGGRPSSDLGRIQAALLAEASGPSIELTGDGSFVMLTAETSWDAARATAAVLAGLPEDDTVVIREGDVSALDNALSVHGLRTQGWHSVSPWRAALQVLPLAIELAFEPKDPQRVLELLTLPIGPFVGLPGRRLAEALVASPGIGGPAWLEAKARLAAGASSYTQYLAANVTGAPPEIDLERTAQLVARIADWLEQPGDDAVSGAPKSALLGVVERVRAWLISRLPSAPEDATLLAATRHAGALRAALENDARSSFSLVDVRRLAESALESGTTLELIKERAGRISYVDSPGNLGVPRKNVVWWSFVDGQRGIAALPWRRRELAALANVGVRFPDPKALLTERGAGWRRAVLAATERIILVAPGQAAGIRLVLHPLWDELVARAGWQQITVARITVATPELRAAVAMSLLERPPLQKVEVTELPGGRTEWLVPAVEMSAVDEFSAASLNTLLGCPLQWALQYRAGLRGGGYSLPALILLNGTLGHRLVELLHGQDSFGLPKEQLRGRAESFIDQLFEREGAILLRAGMAFERQQLRSQLVGAMIELARLLSKGGLRIVAVEKPIEVPWRTGNLSGRIDVLVSTRSGAQAIIDLKWGIAKYRDLLRSGHALQLAVYAFAHAAERSEAIPEAAYFSLKQQTLFGLPSEILPNAETVIGPSLAETWKRIETSIELAERAAVSGQFAVTGLRRSLPLLTSLGVPDDAHALHFALKKEASCGYCGFDALCGRRWEDRA